MNRLLLFEPRRLGDAIMSLPFLLGAEAAGWEVHVACSDDGFPLYSLALPLERIVRLGGNGSIATVRALRRIGAAAAVSVWANAKDHVWLRASGALVRIGFPTNDWNYLNPVPDWRRRRVRQGALVEDVAGLFGLPLLTTPLWRESKDQHHVEDWGQIAAALGFPLRTRTPWLALPEGRLPEVAERFLAVHEGKAIWLLHPGSYQPGKRWPHYARLVREVFEPRGVPLVIVQTSEAPVPPEAPTTLAWERGPLGAFLRLVSRCDVILGNDSASSHAGAAFGKRTITVFGSGSSRWFSPYSLDRTDSLLFESSVCSFRPCFDRCVQPSYVCLEGVPYERVAAGIVSVFDEKEAA